MERADSLATNDLVEAAKTVFAGFGLPNKRVSGAGMNFTSDILTLTFLFIKH